MDKRIIFTLLILVFIILYGAAIATPYDYSVFNNYRIDHPESINVKKDTIRDNLSNSSSDNKRIEKIRVFSGLWTFDQEVDSNRQLLTNNVRFIHKDATMVCDSAWFYEKENRLIAMDNVHIYQGDSLHISCDWLEYDGITLLSRLRHNVHMEHGENSLFTDSLDYSRATGLGYYFDYGTIVDSLNTLSSVYGEYSTVTRKAVFEDSVVLENPNFTLYSDRLNYNTITKVADINSPSRIVGDSGYILTSSGVYDTQNDIAYLMNRSKLYSGTRTMTGDSLVYQRNDATAKLYGDVELRDTLEQKSLHGDYLEYHEDTEFGLARENAYVKDFSSKDTLWAHAIEMQMIKDTIVGNHVKGIGNVRVYRADIQAISDSLIYNSKDSVMNLIGNPYVWSGTTQVSGDSIKVHMVDGDPRIARIINNAYVIQEVEPDLFHDQMKGQEIIAYFNNNNLDSVRTNGNAEAIYYVIEKDSVVRAHVKVQSTSILMHFIDEDIYSIKCLDKTKAIATPIKLLTEEDKVYPGFIWFDIARPKSFVDIFRKTPTKDSEKKEEPLPEGVMKTTEEEGIKNH